MENLRQALTGLLIALISILIVMGGLSLSLAEGGLNLSQINVQNLTPEATETPQPTPLPGMPSLTPLPTRTHTATYTVAPPPACMVPKGWTVYMIQADDTLSSLAQRFGVSEETIAKGNCMPVIGLVPDTALWLPPLPSTPTETATVTSTPLPPARKPTSLPTNTIVACGHPSGWVLYVVQHGDTLFSISQAVGSTVSQLQYANCMGSSTLIRSGSTLYVPFLPTAKTRTPTSTRVPPSRTPVPSFTPTLRPTNTPTFIPTSTQTSMPTQALTPVPTNTPTQQPTDTPTPIPTDTPTLPPTQTSTPIPTSTPTFIPTTTGTSAAN